MVGEWMRERTNGTEMLSLRVFADNVRARRFDERLGWTLTGRVSRTSFPPHPVLLEYRLPAAGVGGYASPGE